MRQILEYVGKGLTAVKVDYLILHDWGDQRENKNYTELTELAQNAGISVLYVKRGDMIQYGRCSWMFCGLLRTCQKRK